MPKTKTWTVTKKTKRVARIKLLTWDDVAAYKAKHLTPVAFSPKGRPIYRAADVAALNIQFPDE